jgi:hypothetical protein
MLKPTLIIAAALAGAGCASGQKDLDETYGAAFNANAAAQIVDATPAEGAPRGDGNAADLAILRYKTDKLKEGDTGDFEAGSDAEEEGGS